ncbi:uncharacterized protein [Macrobrachium rosenbergii]|uniref:uncharacterized protein n=1 Tax=Macrobrachium rosenbergii TaxID=79674 RepID=UPI0034D53056
MLARLGTDFLKEHNLLVDVASKQFIPKTAPISSLQQLIKQPTTVSSQQQQIQQTILKASIPLPEICRLLQEFPEVFKEDLQHDLTKPAKHNIQHHIETEGPPVHARFRRLAPEKLAYAKQVFREMEKAEICQKAPSPRASPLHIVLKPGGTWWPCRDYWQLKVKTKPDRYPLPNIADIANQSRFAEGIPPSSNNKG